MHVTKKFVSFCSFSDSSAADWSHKSNSLACSLIGSAKSRYIGVASTLITNGHLG